MVVMMMIRRRRHRISSNRRRRRRRGRRSSSSSSSSSDIIDGVLVRVFIRLLHIKRVGSSRDKNNRANNIYTEPMLLSLRTREMQTARATLSEL